MSGIAIAPALLARTARTRALRLSAQESFMLRLYGYYRSSATYRVRIALEHKQLAFENVPVSILDGENRERAHLARNPLGQVPVLEIDGGSKPVHLSQSLAILEYLEERSPAPALLPQDALLRARARELAEMVNSGIQPLQNTPLLARFRELGADPDQWARDVMRRGLEALLARARDRAGAFLVGDEPSIADVCLVPQMYNARRFAVPLDGLDELVEIDARCRALPRWDRAQPERQADAPPSPTA